MPPKKKKPGADEEDKSTEQLVKKYRQKCEAHGAHYEKAFKLKVDEAIEGTGHLQTLHWIESPLGPLQCAAIFDALCELNYKHVIDIKFPKCECGDQGVEFICKYLLQPTCKLQKLNLMCNEITAMGCGPIGQCLFPVYRLPIKKLKLDFNNIGAEGLRLLTDGLQQNPSIERLSLNYCNIDAHGAKYFQEILGYIDSNLQTLKLRGNCLRNDGVFQLFRALETNQMLDKLIIANNQFGECEEIPVMEKICEVMTKNDTLGWYDMEQNGIYDKSAKQILLCAKEYKHIYKMILPDLISKDIMDEFKFMKKRKKKKKKKKKKGKKGGKKKKK